MSFCGSPPSAATVMVSRPELYMIDLPSGDQAGHAFGTGSLVSGRKPEPSTACTHKSAWPYKLEMNATRLPSGDSAECITRSPAIDVICRAGLERSIGHSHRFRLPTIALLYSSVPPSRVTCVHIGS